MKSYSQRKGCPVFISGKYVKNDGVRGVNNDVCVKNDGVQKWCGSNVCEVSAIGTVIAKV